jgi:hypothetical protein
MKKIIHKNNYISLDLVNEIKEYFDKINDSLFASRGPKSHQKTKLGWQGCWDRNLHYEKLDNPIHRVISKLKEDFGDFEIVESSIRYLSAPFLPHSDIRSSTWLNEHRNNGYKEGFVYLIPLWWKDGYIPGTAFFNNPANIDEPLYSDMLDILPNYSTEYEDEGRNFSVRKIIKWKSPGDLIAWENFQWHSSCSYGDITYNKNTWAKEFISIETWAKSDSNQ